MAHKPSPSNRDPSDHRVESLRHLKPEFITDADGNRKSVVLSVEDFERLVEEMEDLADILRTEDDERVSHDDVEAELKRDGIL